MSIPLRPVIVWTVITAFALLLFLAVPSIVYGDVLPRAAFFYTALALAAALWGLGVVRGEFAVSAIPRDARWIIGAGAIAVVIFLALSFVQPSPLRHIFGDAGTMLGVWPLALSVAAIAVVASVFGSREWQYFRWAFLGFMVFVLLAGFGDAFNAWGGDGIQLPFRSASDLMIVLVVALALVWWSWRKRDVPRALLVAFAAAMTLLFVLTAIWYFPATTDEGAMISRAAREAIARRPWTGWGVAGVGDALHASFDAAAMVSDGATTLPDFEASTRVPLTPLVRGGVFGAAGAILLAAAVAVAAIRRARRDPIPLALVAGLATLVVFVSPSPVFLGAFIVTAALAARRETGGAGATQEIVASVAPIAPLSWTAIAVAGVIVLVVAVFTLIVPLQAAARIADLGKQTNTQNLSKVDGIMRPRFWGIGGHDLRLALAREVTSGRAPNETDALAAVEFTLEEMRALEKSGRDLQPSVEHLALLSIKMQLAVKNAAGTRAEVEERLRGIMNEGRAVYDRAIAINPNHPDVYIERGVLSFMRGFYLQADNDFFTKAVKLMPTNARAVWSRGRARDRYQSWSRARGDLITAVDELNYPYRNRGNLAYLTRTFAANGDSESAERFVSEWLTLLPDDGTAHFEHARLLESAGNLEAAGREYAAAIRLDPTLQHRREQLQEEPSQENL